jgi:hypothetical protein
MRPAAAKQTVELKADGQSEIWQKEYWGSHPWRLSNNRRTRRTYVEGVFGNLKNASAENVTRGTFRITGLARVPLFLGIAATAHNIRQLRNWNTKYDLGDPQHPLLTAESETYLLHVTPTDYQEYEDFQKWKAAKETTDEEAA